MDRNAPHPTPADADRRDWHALVDDRLPPAEAEALRQELASDPVAQETIARWQHQRAQLRALHQDLERVPVPEPLLQAALAAAEGQARRRAGWWRWGGMAASVLAAFGLGWTGHGQWASHRAGPGLAGAPGTGMAIATVAPAQRFAQQAAVAHAVYQPEVRHPVEVTAAQQEHLVQWLSKRLDRPLKVPVLAPQGFELVGGRLLPGDSGARAQFMYQNAAGQRITLYLGALAGDPVRVRSDPKAPPPSPAPSTAAFQFTHDGPVPAFYWVEQNFGYALSGQLSRAQLLALATSIYEQVQ